ncbi:MAG: tRNA nucleotidyltransferase [Flavobacteriaceae bacterium]|mgnify:FL=1|nr:tRNA nucleotidyltransferase [Flavobacteriaceae bacterium]|tara:strand:+ start:39086 stop:40504 length:1419 start_codon:yes stop_codon:yes gene_type:complete
MTNLQQAIKLPVFEKISSYCKENNIECYVVGGYVRDFLLKRKSKDIDVLVLGNGIEIAKNIARSLDEKIQVTVFNTFGTAYFKYKDFEIEFVGARKESYSSNSRNPIVESGTFKEDIDRRDFKINSMAISLHPKSFGDLIDLHNGLDDLENCVINTPLDAVITFSDDPLRMLRAIRFASQLNFSVSEKLIRIINELKSRIEIVTNERIVDELNKILLSDTPSIGFNLLEKTGLLDFILPEITNLKGIDEIEGQKHKDNFYHTLEVLDNICKSTENLWLRWAALLHDIGKAPTKKFDKKIGWTFHGHEFEGSKMVYKLFKRLKMPLNEKMKYVQKLVLMSSRPIVLAQNNVTDSAVRRLIFDASDAVDDLMTLCEADITTKNKSRFKRYHENFRLVREKIIKVEEKDNIRNFQPPITGAEIMKTFNLKPCKTIGSIKESIKEAILEGDIENNYEEAFKLMIKEGEKLGLSDGK